jgi:hypothetical protein
VRRNALNSEKSIELPATNHPSSVKLVRSAVLDGVATAIELGYS